MDLIKARRAYARQKAGARRRGIGWEFNFHSWLDWWGTDFGKRGRGVFSLQMQRFADDGPYAAWNVRKGTPKDNAKTRGNMKRLANTLEAKQVLEATRDAAPSRDPKDLVSEDEAYLRDKLGVRSSYHLRDSYAVDKRR